MAQTLSGKTSLFGTDPKYGIHDPSDSGRTASGISETIPGIAVYNRSTLGGYWAVTFHGQTHVLRQSDIGPAPWTGRVVDFLPSAAAMFGINPHNFPTDSHATLTYLGKNPRNAAAATAAAAPGAGAPPPGALPTPAPGGDPFAAHASGALYALLFVAVVLGGLALAGFGLNRASSGAPARGAHRAAKAAV